MDCRISDSQRVIPPCEVGEPAYGRGGLFDAYDRTSLPVDDGCDIGPRCSHFPGYQARQISLLASLLEPFAKDHAMAAASSLIETFGSIDRALNASAPQLEAVLRDYDELGKLIVAAHSLVETCYRFGLRRKTISPQDPELIRLFRKQFKNSRIEKIRCVFLGNGMSFIREEEHSKGSNFSVHLHAGELVQRAFQLGATGLILAHNHPSGCSDPSQDDIEATVGLAAILDKLGLKLVDHLIFTERSVFSFARAGEL